MKNPNWNSISLKPGERLDELQRNGYVIIQDQERFCFGMDAVLLSGFARVKDGGSVLDMGQGQELSRFFWRPRRMPPI